MGSRDLKVADHKSRAGEYGFMQRWSRGGRGDQDIEASQRNVNDAQALALQGDWAGCQPCDLKDIESCLMEDRTVREFGGKARGHVFCVHRQSAHIPVPILR